MRTIIYYSDRKKVEAKIIENMFKGYSLEKITTKESKKDNEYVENIEEKLEDNKEEKNYDIRSKSKTKIREEIFAKIDEKIAEEKEKYPNEDIQLIFFGTDKIVIDAIRYVKKEYENIRIKLISDTYEGLIFDSNEMENFANSLKLAKENIVEKIYFFKKGIAKAYEKLGYDASYIMQNYVIAEEEHSRYEKIVEEREDKKQKERKLEEKNLKDSEEKIIIGAYPSGNEWNNNIYNIFSIPCFIENAILKYKVQSKRDKDFVNMYNIEAIPVKFKNEDVDSLISNISESDVVLDLDFTANHNINFLIAASLGIPCLVGDNHDMFYDLPFMYSGMITTCAEDNPYENAENIENILESSDIYDLKEKLKLWKKEYDKIQKQNLENIIGE